LSIADYRYNIQQLAIGYIALSQPTVGSVSQPANFADVYANRTL